MKVGEKWLATVVLALAVTNAMAESAWPERASGPSGHTPMQASADRVSGPIDQGISRGAVPARLVALRGQRADGASRRDAEELHQPPPDAPDQARRNGLAHKPETKWGGFVTATRHAAVAPSHARDADAGDYDLTGGVDYRFSPGLAGGVALSWTHSAKDAQRSAGTGGANNWGLSAYATYNSGDWYVDGHFGFARLDYVARPDNQLLLPFGVAATARDSAQGNQWAATVGAGYDVRLPKLTVTPYGRMSYVKLKLDSFTEREPLAAPDADFGSRSTESLQSALGVRLSTTLKHGERAVTPYVALEWNRELRGRSAALATPYTPDPFTTFLAIPRQDPGRDFVTVSVGLASVYGHGYSAFAKLDTVLGLDRAPSHAFMIGVRGVF